MVDVYYFIRKNQKNSLEAEFPCFWGATPMNVAKSLRTPIILKTYY